MAAHRMSWVWISTHAYRLLLTTYPLVMRREYGHEMAHAFRMQCGDDLRRGGVGGLWRLWRSTLRDYAVTIFAEWRDRGDDRQGREFYNQAHGHLRDASFQIAARLLWQEFSATENPTGLAKSLVEDLKPDDFVTFMDAWTVPKRICRSARRTSTMQSNRSTY